MLRDNAIGPIYCTSDECGPDLVNEGQGTGIGTDSLSGDDHIVANNFIFGTDREHGRGTELGPD